MLKKEKNILEPFTREIWKPLTFRQVKKLSGNRSDNYVHKTLKEFVREGVLEEKKVGNIILYSVSGRVFALNTAGYVAEHKAGKCTHLPHKNIQKIISRIKTAFYSFVITGSYAKKTQKKSSDIDVVVICSNKQNTNSILAEIKLESELSVPEIHPHVFTQSQLLEMLASKDENFGKEIARNNLIITGAKQFYSIIMEAAGNGFNG